MAGVSLATGVSAIDSINLSTANITGVLPGVNGGTGAANTGKVITLANNLTTVGNFAMTLTATAISNATLPAGTKTLAATDGTGASGTWGINVSGNAATVTTNANLTGPITSSGNATAVASQTGTGNKFVMDASPTITTPQIAAVQNGSNTGIAIDTSGRVTKPNSPAFSARVETKIDNVTGDGTQYVIIFNTEDQDVGSNYNNTTGIFTAPIAGSYIFSVAVELVQMTIANTSLFIELLKNSSDVTLESYAPTMATGDDLFSSCAVISLAANDTVKVNVFVSGGTKTVDVGALSRFSGALLG